MALTISVGGLWRRTAWSLFEKEKARCWGENSISLEDVSESERETRTHIVMPFSSSVRASDRANDSKSRV